MTLDLDSIQARVDAATEGPWEWSGLTDTKGWSVAGNLSPDILFVDMDGDIAVEVADATFIAHARQDIPALLAEVKRLREALQALSQLGETE